MSKNLTWLEKVRHCPSPNFDARPPDTEIELLVIHSISLPPNQFGGPFIEQLFTNSLDKNAHPSFVDIVDLRVSAHLLIRRDGEIIQYVSLDKRAWHAGISNFKGRNKCNDFSIGIELEGCDNIPYTDIQYLKLTYITKILQQNWPSLTQIVGHCDIAPERKTDPGPLFDWERFKNPLR
ncbi:1,6-anhydro-N-acetylmuramyl-L-alanine amidase AmpD [Candidatus Halobeggiatoa sp. HSG11]|nr:1,6-anhydro-N-acetylmuramyl-L-alanine amidase AmpD [Candidatus Halobeggiatoa sp. HSG11]